MQPEKAVFKIFQYFKVDEKFLLQDLVSDIGVDIKMFYSLFLLVSRSSLQDQFLSYHKQSSSIRNKIRLVTFAVSRDNSSKYILNGDLNISCFFQAHTTLHHVSDV